jgi:hypothetical protein
MFDSSGSTAELDEGQMPPALEVSHTELERATFTSPSVPRMAMRTRRWKPLKGVTPRAPTMLRNWSTA